jgi:hypothetical protein
VDAHNTQIRIVNTNQLSLRVFNTEEIISSIAITDKNKIVVSFESQILVIDANTLHKIKTISIVPTEDRLMMVKPHGAGFFAFNSKTFSLFPVKIKFAVLQQKLKLSLIFY